MTREQAINEINKVFNHTAASDIITALGGVAGGVALQCRCEQAYETGKKDGYVSAKAEEMRKSEWIPVTERLPEEKGLYLVSVKNDHNRRYSKTCWFHGGNNWFARQDVLAWMPLPEPYREVSE